MSWRPYKLIKECLSRDDLSELRALYKSHASHTGTPCFALIDKQENSTFQKISNIVERNVRCRANYLNDFIFFTDIGFSTDWHVDTELFCFERAVNAWILLYPDQIHNPLAFIDGLNGEGSPKFHSIENDEGAYYAVNYSNNDIREITASSLLQCTIDTPDVKCGDILLLDPRYFHKTNTTVPKSACAIKYILGNNTEWLASEQVPGALWPEVDVYNEIVKSAHEWGDVLRSIRTKISTYDLNNPLLSGFYPEKFQYLQQKIQSVL